MTALNSEGLEKAVAQAIFDPGATEGYKGDRTLTEWQVQAVMRAITSHTPALPPVDGLEVVAWDVAPKGLPAEPTKSHSFVAEIERQGGSITPLVTLSQASSVIAGLTAERDAAQASAFVWENRFVLMDGAYNREFSRAQAAEARISSLEKENKRLREALGNAERSFNNIRGAIESNQVVDKDAHGTAIRARDAARQALEDHNG